MHFIVIITLISIGLHIHLISAHQEDELQINMNENTPFNTTRISLGNSETITAPTTIRTAIDRKHQRIKNNSIVIHNNFKNISTKYGKLSKLAPFVIDTINNNETNKRMHFSNDLNGEQKRRHHRRYKNNKRHWTKNQTIFNNALGDLSCIINGLKPAPLVKNYILKYLRIKNIGHTKSFLEAKHYCYAGFKKVYFKKNKMKHLICKKNKWIGQIPTCELIDKNVCPNRSNKCDQICTVQDGKPTCSCFAGFKSVGKRCLDINECQTNSNICEYACSNTIGSYRCKCPKGYRTNLSKSCTDINECLLRNGHGPCQDKCVNSIGGYNCSCELSGTKLSQDNHSCEDVDECSNNNGGCSHICLNTLSRAFCSCPDGWRLDKDWKTCVDVDECLEPEICTYECVNTIGSFHCVTDIGGDQPIVPKIPDCVLGYFYDKFSKRCEEDNQLFPFKNTTFEIVCPPIYPPKRGYLDCNRPIGQNQLSEKRIRNRITNRPGSKCNLKCPKTTILVGTYSITCESDGQWVGDSNGTCHRNSGPRLMCPKDTTIEIPKNISSLKIPKPKTSVKFDGEISVEPSWITNNVTIKPGVTKIMYTAKSYVTHLTTSCSFLLTILDGEPPTIERCPETQKYVLTKKHESIKINWIEPIFRDNVNVTNVSQTYEPSNFFSVGSHLVIYEAVDAAGYKSKCIFKIIVNAVSYQTWLQLPPV